MTPAEFERSRTWILEIAEALLPDAKWRQEGAERRAIGTKLGLSINTAKSGVWFAHAAGVGSWHPVSLVKFIKGCSDTDAAEWMAAWLRSHRGTGSVTGTVDEAAEIEAAVVTQQILAELVPATGTAAETYLRSRGITKPIPDFVKFLPNARVGECAIAALLTAHDRTVGVQIGYLDPDGRKSLIKPIRRRFMLEKMPEAVFEIPAAAGSVVTDLLASTSIAEGVENMLSLAELDRPWRLVGLPGIAALPHVPVQPGERIIVFRDGDKPGSGGDKGLIAGVDAKLLQGATVRVTETPDGEDPNSILMSGDREALIALGTASKPAKLSQDGEIERLSRLDPLDYDKERKTVATGFKIRLGTLDDAVNKRRNAKNAKLKTVTDDPVDIDEIELLDEPVDLEVTFDEILVELKRYIVAPDMALATVAVWCAHAHLCHHEKLLISRSPRLAIQGRSPGSGKTIVLTVVSTLVPRARLSSSLTASTVLRVVAELRPTLLIDEADRVLRDHNSDLLAILNAGDRRLTGFVDRSVPTSDGGWMVKRFPVFGPVAFAGIDELPPTQQDRSIVIQMQRALFSEVPGYLEEGTSPELTLARRRLATWAQDLDELPRPDLPEVLRRQAGRTGDNWRWMIAIADLAGERWSKLIRQAALEAVAAEARPSPIARLLDSIKRVFAERAANKAIRREDDRVRIATSELIECLRADPEEEWETANRGRAITAYWLRDNLRQLLDPPGTAWWEDPRRSDGKRGKTYRGYYRSQFDNAIARYLPQTSSHHPYEPSDVSDGTGEVIDNAQYHPMENPSDGEASDGISIRSNPSDGEASDGKPIGSNRGKSSTSADPPDTSDGLKGNGEDISKPNGQDLAPSIPIRLVRPGRRAPCTSLESDIVDYDRGFPGKPVAAIAKMFGQPKALVVELLGRST